jgi:hypothetical protein
MNGSLRKERRDAPSLHLRGELAQDARDRAETCWSRHKASIAAYWKACAVYAGHIRRDLEVRAPSKLSQRLTA